ncbi:hypothetical protein D3C87_1179930 [compost metagenome]
MFMIIYSDFFSCKIGYLSNKLLISTQCNIAETQIFLIMPIKYKLIEKGQPGVVNGGTKKWYASVFNDGEITIDDLVKQIEKFFALSEADIRGVIIALENVIQEQLANGKIIRLDKLGSFYPSLSSEGVVKEADFTSANIRSAKVNYRPGKRINDALATATFQKKS